MTENNPKQPDPDEAAVGETFISPTGDEKSFDNEKTVMKGGIDSQTSIGLPTGNEGESDIPETFGRYKILKSLGQGAMGAVYLAHDTQLDRKVALKIPKFTGAKSVDMLERFYREARSAATLRHPNICPVFDVGEIDGQHYITMAFIAGRPLKDFARSKKKQPERQVVSIIRKLALGLADAHKQGVIHRDLKPANVMIDSKGEPVVMDFGLARRSGKNEVQMTQSGTILGTPAYMSPEQVEGDQKKINAPADIYSLGVIFYELLTGQLPFTGGLMSILKQIAVDDPQPPSKLRDNLDPLLEAICLKMMSKSIDERYESMEDVAKELTSYLKSPAKKQAATRSPPVATGRKPKALATPVADKHGHKTVLGWAAWMKMPRLAVVIAAALLLMALLPFVLSSRGPAPEVENPQAESSVKESVVVAKTTDTKSAQPSSDATSTPGKFDFFGDVKKSESKPAKSMPSVANKTASSSKTKSVSRPTEKVASTNSKPTDPKPKTATKVPKKKSEPKSAKLPHKPQTYIVGVGNNQIPDLKTAFEKAQPGDTILIRHRGPLEFDPVDLIGKTPLTIIGDTNDKGTEYWPILRQAALDTEGKPESQETESAGMFHANQLILKLQKLHLAVAGPKRANISAVFAFTTGRVELDQCTVTVGVQDAPGRPPGDPSRWFRSSRDRMNLIRQTTPTARQIMYRTQQRQRARNKKPSMIKRPVWKWS